MHTAYQHWVNGVFQDNIIFNWDANQQALICANSTFDSTSGGISGTCINDNGAPIIKDEILYGIHSINYPPCENGLPNVATSVGHFLDDGWIMANSNY